MYCTAQTAAGLKSNDSILTWTLPSEAIYLARPTTVGEAATKILVHVIVSHCVMFNICK